MNLKPITCIRWVVFFGAVTASGFTHAAPLSAAEHRALQAQPAIQIIETQVQAGDWRAVYQQVSTVGDQPPASAEQELTAYTLATGLRDAPMQADGRRWLQAVAQWPTWTMQALPDAGHRIRVPAFPAAQAARVTLRAWQARDDAAELRAGLSAAQWPLGVSLNNAVLARLNDTEFEALHAIRPAGIAVPADWALRWAQHNPSADRINDWITALKQRATPVSSQRLSQGLEALLRSADAATFDQLAAQAQDDPVWVPAWLAALGRVAHPSAQSELQRWVGVPRFGLDALLSLGRSESGRHWMREQVEAYGPADSDQRLRRMLIVLAQSGEVAYLQAWAAQRVQDDALSTEVQAWIGG